MRLSETYYSLSGEGVHAGVPAQIVRLQGCNLRCSWCDTPYAQDPDGGRDVRVDTLLATTEWPGWALITGGEPLLQEADVLALVLGLARLGVSVEIETNGSFAPPIWWERVTSWNADIKCPSSGMVGKSRLEWLYLRPCDQAKFVVADDADLAYVALTLSSRPATVTVLVSPVYPWTTGWLQTCAKFCKAHRVRLSLQQHKIIYGDRRGV